MSSYDFAAVEARWRSRWAQDKIYRTPVPHDGQETFYCLDFFPYPSGYGLSVGHGRNYVPSDVVARYQRMRGRAVLHPMGWDAFGLPAENEAIAQGTPPADIIARYAANYRRQLDLLGCSYDWEREVNSSDPAYYRWTQWLFLLFYRRGLAYRAAAPVNWCGTCRTVLADEEIEEGHCWRCHQPVVQRMQHQWFLRITAYADELLDSLDRLDWPEPVVAMQRHWIGRSVEAGSEPGRRGGTVRYHLRDWLVSRQRYWGAPIPIVHCPDCGEVPVPEEELPVLLPPVPDYRPRGDGRSPLVNLAGFVQTACPRCGRPAERETDTLTGFVCSSWYFFRFASPHEQERPFDPAEVARWLPVDLYMGGVEHAIGHLLYARFFTKVLADAGLVSFREPFPWLRSQGVLHIRDRGNGRVERMSKSRGNIVTPDSVVARFGADATRLHVLFIAPFEANAVWEVEDDGSTPQHIEGVRRFLERVWRLVQAGAQPAAPSQPADASAIQWAGHRTIREVTAGIEALRFNTSISRLMEFAGALEEHRQQRGDTPAFQEARRTLVLLLAPFAPFVAEEAWARLGQPYSVHQQPWPAADPSLACAQEIEIAVQVDGRVRGRITVAAEAGEEAVRAAALAAPPVQRALDGRAVRQVVVVPGRAVNVVTG
jgi:leucyl-tRNA synthetase